jgi:hypothetical protein
MLTISQVERPPALYRTFPMAMLILRIAFACQRALIQSVQ